MLVRMALFQPVRCIVALLVHTLGSKLVRLWPSTASLNYNFKQTSESLKCLTEAAVNLTKMASQNYHHSMNGTETELKKQAAPFS